jgi:hypothetical protein
LVFWIFTTTRYEVSNEALTVRSGPFRWVLPLHTIQSLSASRSLLSSPALSLDRIAIGHTGGVLLISPRHKGAFVRAVRSGAPAVAVRGLGEDGAFPDEIESSTNLAAIVPAAVIGVVALAFGAWQFYAGTRAPEATINGDELSISGLYSTRLTRQDVVRLALEAHVTIGRRLQGFGSGRHLRGFFEVTGLGRCRVFASRNTPPFLVIHTRTQPVVISFDDPAKTQALYEDLIRAWHLARPSSGPAVPSPDIMIARGF